MVDPIFDYQFRLILIGDSVVGKSSLLKFFTDGKFAEVSAMEAVEIIIRAETGCDLPVQGPLSTSFSFRRLLCLSLSVFISSPN